MHVELTNKHIYVNTHEGTKKYLAHMCRLMLVQMHRNVCAHACGGQKPASDVLPQELSIVVLETGSLTGL